MALSRPSREIGRAAHHALPSPVGGEPLGGVERSRPAFLIFFSPLKVVRR